MTKKDTKKWAKIFRMGVGLGLAETIWFLKNKNFLAISALCATLGLHFCADALDIELERIARCEGITSENKRNVEILKNFHNELVEKYDLKEGE